MSVRLFFLKIICKSLQLYEIFFVILYKQTRKEMKSKVFKRAWKIYREGNKTWSKSLKLAWDVEKTIERLYDIKEPKRSLWSIMQDSSKNYKGRTLTTWR